MPPSASLGDLLVSVGSELNDLNIAVSEAEKVASLSDILASTGSEISGLNTAVSEAEEAAAKNLLRKGRDRTLIAVAIIATYSLAIIGMFLYVLFTVPSCGTGVDDATCKVLTDSWDKQAENLLNVITITILPIVTLMLGFYFGTEKIAASNPDSLK